MLNQLPKYISLNICNNWLVVKEVGSLDVAMCSSVDRRPTFVLLLEEFRVLGLNDKYASRKFLKWLSIRKVKVWDLSLKSNLASFVNHKTTFNTDSNSCLNHLRVLDIDASKLKSSKDFNAMISTCASLTELHLTGCAVLATDETVRLIADSCPKLKVIHFHCKTESMVIEGTNSQTATDASLICLSQKCCELRSVYLNNFSPFITGDTFSALLVSCPLLCELSMSGADPTDSPKLFELIRELMSRKVVTGMHVASDFIGLDFRPV